MWKLDELQFVNTTLKSLPIDPIEETYTRSVSNACFSLVSPTPLKNPRLVCFSVSALELLGLDSSETQRPDFAEYMCGNRVMKGARPAAHCYCGHQFGYFSGQLGDGATMYLGECINQKGERWECQFKGAGKTPYSRSADGRKVLRSSVREFLCSEINFFLGIPTTRCGSIVTSDSRVVRDIYYNGNNINERCTVILRIAETFLRFGSFEIFKETDPITGRAGPSAGNSQLLKQMLDFTCKTFYPSIFEGASSSQERWSAMYKEIVTRTAKLVAKWQCFGFCHGVLNTDNMSITGVTIDYGPFGYMEYFDRDFICNGSDGSGRYSYKAQPEMCRWNCEKLGEAFSLVLPSENWKPHLDSFNKIFENEYYDIMRRKLGLAEQHQSDNVLIDSLFDVMEKTKADFTQTFRILCDFEIKNKNKIIEKILNNCASSEVLISLLKTKISFIKPNIPEQPLMQLLMLSTQNPQLLAVQFGASDPQSIIQELEEEANKWKERKKLLKKIEEIKQENVEERKNKNKELWIEWFNIYINRLENEKIINEKRLNEMKKINPRIVLRNWIAQKVIDSVEKGENDLIKSTLELFQNPFSDSNLNNSLENPEEKDIISKEIEEPASANTACIGVT